MAKAALLAVAVGAGAARVDAVRPAAAEALGARAPLLSALLVPLPDAQTAWVLAAPPLAARVVRAGPTAARLC